MGPNDRLAVPLGALLRAGYVDHHGVGPISGGSPPTYHPPVVKIPVGGVTKSQLPVKPCVGECAPARRTDLKPRHSCSELALPCCEVLIDFRTCVKRLHLNQA